MATRLYFHAASNALPGTFPTGEQSTALAATWTMTGANTLRTMNTSAGAGPQVNLPGSTGTGTTQKRGYCGFFCSDTFNVNQNVGGGGQTVTLNIAHRQQSTGPNMGAGLRFNIYVWRPSTGAKVGTVGDNLTLSGTAAMPLGNTIYAANGTNAATTQISALAGDVLICEVWEVHTPAFSASTAVNIYYDGSTVNTTTNTIVSNHASFLDFSSDNLTFGTPTSGSISGAFNATLAAATLAATGKVGVSAEANLTTAAVTLVATGKVAVEGSASINCAAATLAATGRTAITGTFGNTLADASVVATGTVGDPQNIGTFNNTLAGATLAATGKTAVTGAASISCAAATLAATGRVAVSGSRVQTLTNATVSATGLVSSAPPVTGIRNVTLAAATLSAAGAAGAAPAVPAPTLPTSNSGGSGASNQRLQRRKFVVPDLDNEPTRTLDDMLGVPREDVKPTVKELPPTPVQRLPIGTAVAASPPIVQYTSSLPLPSPVVDEEEYSDDDLIHLLMLVD